MLDWRKYINIANRYQYKARAQNRQDLKQYHCEPCRQPDKATETGIEYNGIIYDNGFLRVFLH